MVGGRWGGGGGGREDARSQTSTVKANCSRLLELSVFPVSDLWLSHSQNGNASMQVLISYFSQYSQGFIVERVTRDLACH